MFSQQDKNPPPPKKIQARWHSQLYIIGKPTLPCLFWPTQLYHGCLSINHEQMPHQGKPAHNKTEVGSEPNGAWLKKFVLMLSKCYHRYKVPARSLTENQARLNKLWIFWCSRPLKCQRLMSVCPNQRHNTGHTSLIKRRVNIDYFGPQGSQGPKALGIPDCPSDPWP